VLGEVEANGCTGQAPEIQSMYSLNMPVSQLRTKMRQEFERHRYVNQISVVDMLLFQSHAEFQVRGSTVWVEGSQGLRISVWSISLRERREMGILADLEKEGP
jgi:hypothetical protein